MPDKLPKAISTPFQIWLRALEKQHLRISRPKAFLMWTKLSKQDKQYYLSAHQSAIEIYSKFCQGGEEEMQKIKCKPGEYAYLFTKAGQV